MELRELSLKYDAPAMQALLLRAGIRLEPTLEYACGLYEGNSLLACGGCEGSTIKCLAVEPAWQGEALLNTVFSHLYTRLRQGGAREVFVFTKPENIPLFQALRCTLLARTPEAALLTSDPREITRYLEACAAQAPPQPGAGRQYASGAIVMNANPFTRGHLYLAEYAAARCDTLHIFVVQEERSAFPFAARLQLVQAGTAHLQNVAVHPGGRYIISSATFPSYFLKDPAGAAPAHAALDCTLFAEKIAPALGIQARFVGEEPLDPLTKLYNDTMAQVLEKHHISQEILPRLAEAAQPVSASRVRALLQEGRLTEAAALLPESSAAYVHSAEGRALVQSWKGGACTNAAQIGALCCRALREEVDATPKPGLVDRANNGAHTDMDRALFHKSADALQPYFIAVAQAGRDTAALPQEEALLRLRPLGREAEETMFAATGGVNTHKGAIFSLGLLAAAAGRLGAQKAPLTAESLCACAAGYVRGITARELGWGAAATKGERAFLTYGVTGVRGEAERGFPGALHAGLPAYRQARAGGASENESLVHALLCILACTQDTNILTRCGPEAAAWASAQATALLAQGLEVGAPAWRAALEKLDEECIEKNISPGGCADLLAVSWLLDHLEAAQV